MVSRGGNQTGDHQLSDVQARKGRVVLRAYFRSRDRLGMPVRKIQAHEVPGRDLRQVRGGSHPLQSPQGKAGAHRAGLPLLARVVFQRASQPHRSPARHKPARPGARVVLRGLCGHRCGRGAREVQGASERGEIPGPDAGVSRQVQGDDGRRGHQRAAQARGRGGDGR